MKRVKPAAELVRDIGVKAMTLRDSYTDDEIAAAAAFVCRVNPEAFKWLCEVLAAARRAMTDEPMTKARLEPERRIEHIRQTIEREERGTTHWDGCWLQHRNCRTAVVLDALAAKTCECEAAQRERDEAKRSLATVQNAAQTIVRGADRRVIKAAAHEPAARAAIATLDSEREMNAILTGQVEKAEAALAPLRAVVDDIRKVCAEAQADHVKIKREMPWFNMNSETYRVNAAKFLVAQQVLNALPADPSAPTPKEK